MIPFSCTLRSLLLSAPIRRNRCAAAAAAVAAIPNKAVVRHSSSEDSSTSSEQRLHSTDIAFKPAESGWGGGGKYTKNYDTIFGRPSSTSTANETSKTKERTEAAVNAGARQTLDDDGKSCDERGRV